MNRRHCLALGLSSLAALAAGMPRARAAAEAGYRLSGPVTHANLSVYFVHLAAADRPSPATLQEAMAKGTTIVHETSTVNELFIENRGPEPVFVQAGDIVKGGKQDRVLMVSLLLPPDSGRLPIASFCVEQGRWSPRGREDATRFSSSDKALPSRRAKLAMRAPTRVAAAPAPGREPRGQRVAPSETGVRQHEIWRSVAETQHRLSQSVGQPLAAPQSQSSLQLTLESDTLHGEQSAYVEALRPAGERDADIAGFIFAVNGQVSSGDVYVSRALFRKMWPKLINASVTEAIAERGTRAPHLPPPRADQVQEFLSAIERGEATFKDLPAGTRLETRESAGGFYFVTAAAGGWVHRSYLAK